MAIQYLWSFGKTQRRSSIQKTFWLTISYKKLHRNFTIVHTIYEWQSHKGACHCTITQRCVSCLSPSPQSWHLCLLVNSFCRPYRAVCHTHSASTTQVCRDIGAVPTRSGRLAPMGRNSHVHLLPIVSYSRSFLTIQMQCIECNSYSCMGSTIMPHKNIGTQCKE